MGICSLIPARASRETSVLRAPHSEWLLQELHPGLCWGCLGSSSSSQLELELGWERVGDAAGATKGSQFDDAG